MNLIDTDPDHISNAMDRLQAAWAAQDAKFAAMPQTQDCPTHGTGAAVLDRDKTRVDAVYTCQACIAEQKAVAAIKHRLDRLLAVGVPADAIHARLANFDTQRPNVKPDHHSPSKFLAAAQAFSEHRVRNLILCGTPGIGKGHLAAALAITAFDAGKSIAWADCFKLFREVHAAYGKDDIDPEDITGRLGWVDFLVLDELCLRDLPADGEEILFTILEARHKAGKQTVLLGNKPAAEVKKWLGSRLADRLRSGGVIFCYGEWDSMRGGDADGAGWLDADELPDGPPTKKKAKYQSCL